MSRVLFEVLVVLLLLREIFWYPRYLSRFEIDTAARSITVTRWKSEGPRAPEEP